MGLSFQPPKQKESCTNRSSGIQEGRKVDFLWLIGTILLHGLLPLSMFLSFVFLCNAIGSVMVKIRIAWVQILTLLHFICVTLGNSFNCFVP